FPPTRIVPGAPRASPEQVTSRIRDANRTLLALNPFPQCTGVVHTRVMLLVIDLVGVFVFALSGATAAVRQRLDFFGVLVLSFATASAGGILRDLLIGAIPPATIADWRYLASALLAGT